MKKILVATEKPFSKEAVDGIRKIVEESGNELVLLENYTDNQQLLDAVAEVDAMIIRSDKATREVIEAAKNLKVVVRAGAGYDNIDLEAATEKGVVAMNTPGQNSNAVAELVFGMLISLVRSGFDGAAGSELRGKKLGLHAFGYIGKLVAQIANGFGMEVYAYSPSLARNPKLGEEFNVTAVQDPVMLYEKCDIVSLHMPANADTKGSINYEVLSKMPDNGVIINTARKEVVNEADMVRIMEEKPKFKYGTDIKPGNHDEMAEKFAKRYLASAKKCGAQTAEANMNAGLAAANQIVKFFQTGDETFRVNK
ncbi:MAG: NAD(P)-dependent oxidoreductase [Bacteroidales bacterium]|jgi:D-3-phosphoglycerate dehydrogenase|nr:3-phosphoglycerate dehydrogenase [Bacteroidales bacterium]